MRKKIEAVKSKFKQLEIDEDEDRELFTKLIGVSNELENKASNNIVTC